MDKNFCALPDNELFTPMYLCDKQFHLVPVEKTAQLMAGYRRDLVYQSIYLFESGKTAHIEWRTEKE